MAPKSTMQWLVFCAALSVLAAPIRAGGGTWINSDDLEHIVKVPPGWAAVADVPGLTPKGIAHAFSLAPGTRAFVLDIAARNPLRTKGLIEHEVFVRARELAGNPPTQRVQIPDYSLFEYFRTATVQSGRTIFRLQGVLYKYGQLYYLTFSSARGYPGGNEWQEAIQFLASLTLTNSSVDGWVVEFSETASAPSQRRKNPPAAAKLKFTTAVRDDGRVISFNDITIFGCKNFYSNRYLFNEDRTAHCLMVTLEDHKSILAKVDYQSWKDGIPYFEYCPKDMRQEPACDPERFRNF